MRLSSRTWFLLIFHRSLSCNSRHLTQGLKDVLYYRTQVTTRHLWLMRDLVIVLKEPKAISIGRHCLTVQNLCLLFLGHRCWHSQPVSHMVQPCRWGKVRTNTCHLQGWSIKTNTILTENKLLPLNICYRRAWWRWVMKREIAWTSESLGRGEPSLWEVNLSPVWNIEHFRICYSSFLKSGAFQLRCASESPWGLRKLQILELKLNVLLQ